MMIYIIYDISKQTQPQQNCDIHRVGIAKHCSCRRYADGQAGHSFFLEDHPIQ